MLEASAAPLFDEEGRWSGARGVCRDVTEARQRDVALARARSRERLTTYIVRMIRDEVEPERMLDAAAAALSRALSADGCAMLRSVSAEERREGKERCSTCSSRWSTYH